MKAAACSAFVLAFLVSTASADNWPHWRGPTGNGTAPNASPPIEWSTTKNVRWKAELAGSGLSSPIVWENQVFVTTAVPTDGPASGRRQTLEFKLLSFDRNNGQLHWQRTATVARPHEGTHETNGFASASPCTDGQFVYAHFGSRGLYCYSMSGELVWKRDDFGKMQTFHEFGEGSSPTLAGNMILVPWDHAGPSALYALDKRTGNTIWKTDRDEPTEWSTPLVVEHDGHPQVVLNGQNAIRSYDLATGKELWRFGGKARRPISSAVALPGLVIVCSGFQGSFIGGFRLDGQGNLEGTDQVSWTLNRDAPDVASPILSSGRLYFYKAKSGLLSCVDAATGRPHYSTRRTGLGNTYASPVAAGGHVYLTALNGTTVVIKDADNFEIEATNSLEETIGATPAPVDHELFIRGDAHLYCIAAHK